MNSGSDACTFTKHFSHWANLISPTHVHKETHVCPTLCCIPNVSFLWWTQAGPGNKFLSQNSRRAQCGNRIPIMVPVFSSAESAALPRAGALNLRALTSSLTCWYECKSSWCGARAVGCSTLRARVPHPRDLISVVHSHLFLSHHSCGGNLNRPPHYYRL